MRVPLNDLSRTTAADAEAVVSAMADIIGRGAFLKSVHTAALEARLSERLDGRHILGVANGTDALYLALRALGVSEGTSVATVANAGGYCTGAVLRCGGAPVFVDVDVQTAQMEVVALERVLDEHPGTGFVVVTHLYGLMGDVDAIADLCAQRGVTLVEDCAQSMGAVVGGRAAGTFGKVATLSFYPTKNLGAFGDGGAVVSAAEEVHRTVAALAQYGWERRYEVTIPGGINSRIDEMQAAALVIAERSLDDNNRRRREIVEHYRASVGGGRYFLADSSERYVGHLAVMVTDERSADARRLDEFGIGTGVHYPVPDHRQEAWTGVVPDQSLPATEWLSDRILTVPCFPTMSDIEVDQVSEALGRLG
jgi:dTDP-4-amino-4,6-dideoxygalactose transaminase